MDLGLFDEAGRYVASPQPVLPVRPAGPWDQNVAIEHIRVCCGCPDNVEKTRAVYAAGKIATHGYCRECEAKADRQMRAAVAKALAENPHYSGRRRVA